MRLSRVATILLFSGLLQPLAADESIIARLTFWMPAERMSAFEVAYEERLVPLLQSRGLVPSRVEGRATVDGTFCRLFEVDSVAAILQQSRLLRTDPAWNTAVTRIAASLAIANEDSTIRHWLLPYSAPMGPGTVSQAGSGSRQGLWLTLDHSDGLAKGSPQRLYEDRQGALWMSNGFGEISRFDGEQFVVFGEQDGLLGVRSGFVEDDEGTLWLLGGNALLRYDGSRVDTYHLEDGVRPTDDGSTMASGWPLNIALDHNGDIWLAWTDAITSFDGQTFRAWSITEELAANAVRSMGTDIDGILWVVTDKGLRRYDGSAFVSSDTGGCGAFDINRVGPQAAGSYWFAAGDRLLRSRDDGCEDVTEEAGLQRDIGSIGSMAVDQQGNLWIGTISGGGVRFDGEKYESFTHRDGLGGNQVNSILVDDDGYVWFATFSGGLSRYDGAHFTHFDKRHGLSTTFFFAAAIDSQGTLWFGGREGVYRWNGRSFDNFGIKDGLSGGRITSLFVDHDGYLWIGAEGDGDGLTRWDGTTFVDYSSGHGLPDMAINGITEDGAGRLLVTVWRGGLHRLEADQFQRVIGRGMPDHGFTAVATDHQGNVWYGVSRRLFRDDGVTTREFGIEEGFTGGYISRMHADRQGALWVGGRGGLWKFDGIRFTKTPLQGANSFDIAEDRAGDLWFSSFGTGMVRYDGKVFQELSKRDGLSDNGVHGMVQDTDGDMWITSDGGIMRYHPSTQPPAVRVTGVIADRTYGPVAAVDMTTLQDFVTISFRGRSFTTPGDRMAYLFRLVGHDEDWRVTRDDQVQYSGLARGEYHFEVKAVDRDLNYSQPALLSVTVHPPYGQIALQAGLALSLIGLVTLAVSLGRRRRERDHAREQLVRDQEEELQSARQMLMALMPTSPPAVRGLTVAGGCETANHVGGDLFQYFSAKQTLAIATADVTGHAMEAAIPVVMFSGILDNQMEQPKPLKDLFQSLNRSLCRALSERKFICFAMAEIDTDTRRLRLASCGLPYPLHFHDGVVTELKIDGYPLGVRTDTVYDAIEAQLSEGDYLVMYSDGIPETLNPAEEMYGYERTIETVREACGEGIGAQDLVNRLISSAREFAGDEQQEDDMTCVVVQVADNPTSVRHDG
jgi:serine phosphatase RsbU (regulator of sigma subunit)/ligand-binding sensor domain-containing protein